MSSLKWKEFAKSKTELGNKINYVHDLIKRNNIGQETSKESFKKAFKPVTSKLDHLIDSNLDSRTLSSKKQPLKKEEVGIDYMPEVDYVPPQQEKQLVPKPPTYEQSLEDILEGKKEIYVDPQYFPQDPQELPPEYDDDEEVDYTIDDEDMTNEILYDVGIPNYENVEKVLNQPEMTNKKTKAYLGKIIKDAELKRNQLKGFKANVTKEHKMGYISEAERQEKNKRIDNARVTLNQYISHYKTEVKTIKGSGIKGRRRKQRGGNVMFFNDPNQLLKKLELIIGEILAGNTSIKMRNMGVNILDTLLKIATINRSQYNKIYNNYFKI